MGLMGGLAGMGAAIESSAGFALRSAIEEEKALRIAENTSRLRMSEDTQIRERNKADAATERDRIRTEATGMAEKRTGIMASGAGLDDAGYRGDEGIGVNVQKGQATPTTRDFAMAKGDYTGVMADERADKTLALSREDKLSDNARLDKQFAETVRHNKAVEAHAAADRISPAAKAQLDFATASVVSAQKAEAEAAKSLEAARKGMDPAATATAEKEYAAAKRFVANALNQYNQIGTAQFGDKWKTIETQSDVPKIDVTAAHADAKKAMDKGMPLDEVNARLAKAGVPPLPVPDKKSTPVKTSQPAEPVQEPSIVSIERAGSTLLGGKQFVATMSDGSKKTVSGDAAERQYILMQK